MALGRNLYSESSPTKRPQGCIRNCLNEDSLPKNWTVRLRN